MAKYKYSLRLQKLALLQILGADIIWGLGFVMAQWTLFAWAPMTSTSIRLVLAFALCLVFYALKRQLYWGEFKVAAVPGILNGLTLLFQTWGLVYTTATKSAFITTLYVVMVPVIEKLVIGRRLHPWHWFLVSMALCGTLLISGASFTDVNRGDFLTLLCALSSALHIISLENIGDKITSPFRFNMWQSFWAAPIPIVLAFLMESPLAGVRAEVGPAELQKAYLGMTSLVLLSSILAFSIQAQAQKFLSASVAGLLYLLESIFGALFAYLLLSEKLSTPQWVGGVMIILAAVGVIRLETRVRDVNVLSA